MDSQMILLFFNSSKAFDKKNHDEFLKKLSDNNIRFFIFRIKKHIHTLHFKYIHTLHFKYIHTLHFKYMHTLHFKYMHTLHFKS